MSAFYKAVSGFSLFISIRLLMDYLGTANFGVWVLIFSLFQVILLMDFGLASVLKTKIPVFLHEKKIDLLKSYIKTTYVISFTLGALLFFTFYILCYFVDFHALLNIDFHSKSFVNKLFLLNVLFFCLNFAVNIQKSLYVAFLKGKYAEESIAVNQFGFFVLLLIAVNFWKDISVENKLLMVTFINGLFSLFINFIYTIAFFKREKLDLKTSLKTPFSYIKNLIQLGSKYMFIQLGLMVIFTSDNYIISNAFDTGKVAVYEVVNKLFQFPFLILLAALSPLWSMFAKNYIEKNKNDLLSSFKKFNMFFGVIILSIIILCLLIPFIISIWLNENIIYPEFFILLFGIVTLIRIYVTFYTFFLNGIGKLNLYILLVFVSIMIKIPLSYFFVNLGFDINSVVLSSLIIMLLWLISIPYYCYKIVNKII